MEMQCSVLQDKGQGCEVRYERYLQEDLSLAGNPSSLPCDLQTNLIMLTLAKHAYAE